MSMRKQVYVRAHYRNATRRTTISWLPIMLGILALFSLVFGGSFLNTRNPDSLILTLVSVGSLIIVASLIRRRRHYASYSESTPVVQSR